MRLKKSDPFRLFNEEEGEWRIQEEIKECVRPFKPSPPLWLAFSPLAKPDRMRFLIEKATEMGVTTFIPLKTRYTQGHFDSKKALAWAIEASEQCERMDIPLFGDMCGIHDLLSMNVSWALALERSSHVSAISHANGLIVGPEGGFSNEEKESLKDISSLTLGPRILRSETAVVAGLAIVNKHLSS